MEFFRKIDLSSVVQQGNTKEEKAIKEKYDIKRQDLYEKVLYFYNNSKI